MTLNKALAAEDPAAKEAGAKTARGLYDAADAEFKQSVDVLKELAKTSKQYEAELVQSEFDQANNLIDKAQAFVNLGDSAELRPLTDRRRRPQDFRADRQEQGHLAGALGERLSRQGAAGDDPGKVDDNLRIV